jgi:hypothetical protein
MCNVKENNPALLSSLDPFEKREEEKVMDIVERLRELPTHELYNELGKISYPKKLQVMKWLGV